MSKQTEALKLALEALERYSGIDQRACDAEDAIHSALAEQPAQQQEPVAYMVKAHGMLQRLSRRADVADEIACKYREDDPNAEVLPLYTSPPASKPLTDEQIDLMTSHIYHRGRPVDRDYRICLFRQAEAAHGIKGDA